MATQTIRLGTKVNFIVVLQFTSTSKTSHELEIEVTENSAVKAFKVARDIFWEDMVPNADDGTPVSNAVMGSIVVLGVFPAPQGYISGL